MNMIDIPPFYINQEVVANCNHSQGAFKKGDEFKVNSIFKCVGDWVITIGIESKTFCKICKVSTPEWHFYAYRFSPKIQIGEFISMKQLVEEKLELISVN